MLAVPSLYILNCYFDKRKSLANGLAFCGSGIGQLILPYLMTYFLEEFGFQGGLLLFAGLTLHTLPAAMIMRPIEFYDRKLETPNMADNIGAKRGPGDETAKTSALRMNGSTLLPHNDDEIRDDKGRTFRNSWAGPVENVHSSLEGISLGVAVSASMRHLPSVNDPEMTGINKQPVTADPLPHDGDKAPAPKPSFLRLLFNKTLLRSRTFWMLASGLTFGHSGFLTACFFMPSLAFEIFGDKYTGALLLSIMGGVDIVGRLVGGYLADLGWMKRWNFSGCALLLTGVANILCVMHPVFPVLVVWSVVMGMAGGLYRLLTAVLILDLFGKGLLSCGLGLCYAGMGLGILPFPTILRKLTVFSFDIYR